MADQQALNQDVVSLDGDEVQAPAVSHLTTTTASPTESDLERAIAASNSTTSSAVLARLNAEVLEDRDRGLVKSEPVNKHATTAAFEAHIEATVVELADFWFFQGSPYDHVCLARFNWREFRPGSSVGDFFTRAEFHLQLYAYTLRRTSAIGILLERGYEVLNKGLSATDEAFKVVVEAMVLNWEDMRPYIVDWPVRGRVRTVMIDHPRLLRALEIVMGFGGRGLPMRFSVKWNIAAASGEDGGVAAVGGSAVNARRGAFGNLSMACAVAKAAKAEEVEEAVFFHFKPSQQTGGLGWEMEMEVVASKDADDICEGKEYELPRSL